MKKIWIFGFAALVALAAGVLTQQRWSSGGESATPVAPQLAFSFPDVNDQLQSVSQWRGKIMVINFWASWCGPCLKEIPEFIKLQQEYAERNVQFVGIAIEDKQPVLDYLQRVKVNYPMLIAGDAGSALARQLGNIISAVPFTVIVNTQGQIIHRQPGELTREQFVQLIQPLLPAK